MPATPHALTVALGAHDIVIAVLRDRMRGQFATRVRNNDPRAGGRVASFALQTEPRVELAYVIERHPRLRPEDRRAPTGVLDRVDDPVAADWVVAARHPMVADHILAAGALTGHVITDTATIKVGTDAATASMVSPRDGPAGRHYRRPARVLV